MYSGSAGALAFEDPTWTQSQIAFLHGDKEIWQNKLDWRILRAWKILRTLGCLRWKVAPVTNHGYPVVYAVVSPGVLARSSSRKMIDLLILSRHRNFSDTDHTNSLSPRCSFLRSVSASLTRFTLNTLDPFLGNDWSHHQCGQRIGSTTVRRVRGVARVKQLRCASKRF